MPTINIVCQQHLVEHETLDSITYFVKTTHTDVVNRTVPSAYIHTCLLLLMSMLWYRLAIFDSKRDELSSSVECRIWSWEVSDTNSPADGMPTHNPTELLKIKLKTWTQQPIPMTSEHSVHLTSLPIGFRTWLWRYTCLLLLISMLWHRQAIFESNGDRLSSCAECRIRSLDVSDTNSPADWMPTHKLTKLSRMKQKLELNSPLIWWVNIQLTWLRCRLAFAPGSGDMYMFVVVNFDTLAQASDFRIERRQVVLLCWIQYSKLGSLRHQIAIRLNANSQSDWAIETCHNLLTFGCLLHFI